MSDDQELPVVWKAALAALTTAAGLGVGGATGAVAGAAGAELIQPAAAAAYRELARLRERHLQSLFEQAAEKLELDPADLLDRADTAERKQLLFDAMTAASETFSEHKIAALAKALANGLSDDAWVDEEALIVDALSDLEAPHMRVLAVMSITGRGRSVGPKTIELNARLQDADSVLPALVRHGLVEVSAVEGLTVGGPAKRWIVTGFGRRVLTYLGPPPSGMVINADGEEQ